MRKIFIAMAGATLLGTGIPALAGPDWQIIEHGRKIKAERRQQVLAQENARSQRQSDEMAAGIKEDKECNSSNKLPQ